MPKWLFAFYENIIELLLVVLIGIFIASLLEKYFSKWQRFAPKNPFTAFLYGSLIPVCSCGAIPLIKTMEDRIPFKTIITFIIAAPLLNPYIIMVSLTVLGVQYSILRIVCSFILAISAGYLAEFFKKRMKSDSYEHLPGCPIAACCPQLKKDIYSSTYKIFKSVLPYMVAAGLLSMTIELFDLQNLFKNLNFGNNLMSTFLVILVGVPVYFCNGADVFFLKPFMVHTNLSMETAIAFSLTSTSICVTSLMMLVKFIGKKLTAVILSSIVIVTFLLSILIQLIQNI